MDSAVGKSGNAPDTPVLPGNPVSDAARSAMDDRLSQHAAVQAEALSGPAVLAQPPAGGRDDAVPRLRPDRVETPDRKGGSEDRPAIAVFTGAQQALKTGYRSVSSSADAFAHESPWKAVAFAVLGGVIAGMLLAR